MEILSDLDSFIVRHGILARRSVHCLEVVLVIVVDHVYRRPCLSFQNTRLFLSREFLFGLQNTCLNGPRRLGHNQKVETILLGKLLELWGLEIRLVGGNTLGLVIGKPLGLGKKTVTTELAGNRITHGEGLLAEGRAHCNKYRVD
jgi:hypothetical protein